MGFEAQTGAPSNDEESAKNDFKNDTTSPAAKAGGPVYMGAVAVGGPGVYAPYERNVDYDRAINDFDLWNAKQTQDFITMGIIAGQLQEDAGPLEAYNLWKKLVTRSQSYTAAGRKITPFDVLSMYTKGAGKAGDALWQTQWRGGRKFLVNTQTGEVKYQGPRFETSYQRSIDLTDPNTAKAIATSMFQQMMGRDPGSGELKAFAGALRSAEESSPVVNQITTEYDPKSGEAIGTSTKSTGGFPSDAKAYLAQQQIKEKKEYGSVQASTTYMNALEQAVYGAPG